MASPVILLPSAGTDGSRGIAVDQLFGNAAPGEKTSGCSVQSRPSLALYILVAR